MNDICRTCLSTSNLSSIKDYETIIEKINVLTSINISLDIPNYPTAICSDCVDKVNQFYLFRKIIINADNELREKSLLLNNEIRDTKSVDTKKKTYDKHKKIKSTRKRKKIQSKVISTSTPDDIKIEPTEDDSYLDRLVICESESNEDIKSVKEETEKREVTNLLSCNRCNISFNTKKELCSHKQLYHKKSKSLECIECNTTFSTPTALFNHKRNRHTPPGICSICGVIVRADNLKKHIQKHSEGPVSCKICSKILKNSESLRGHLLIHKGTSFDCEQCDKTFRLKSEYHRHLKKHIDPNVRKKMCAICGKHVRDLQRHLFTHTGERPYICVHCNKGLTSSYALKLHIRQHTNEKPYICEVCNKAFAQKISLLGHLKSKVHNGQAK